jgi:hypothetical protein
MPSTSWKKEIVTALKKEISHSKENMSVIDVDLRRWVLAPSNIHLRGKRRLTVILNCNFRCF